MNKNIVILMLSFVLFSYCTNSNSKPAEKQEGTEIVSNDTIGTLSFAKTVHNFGTIDKDKKVSFRFEFENLGNEPVLIQDVSTTCGCTASEWSKAPVEKGQKGFITVIFNPKNRAGTFNKSIFVKSTAPAPNDVILLKIKGEIDN